MQVKKELQLIWRFLTIVTWYILLTAIGLKPVAVVQYTFTHKQYTEQHNENRKFWKSAGRAPSLRVIPWLLPYNWGKSSQGSISLGVWICWVLPCLVAVGDGDSFIVCLCTHCMFMYSLYVYVLIVCLCTHSHCMFMSDYPDWGFSVLFPHL